MSRLVFLFSHRQFHLCAHKSSPLLPRPVKKKVDREVLRGKANTHLVGSSLYKSRWILWTPCTVAGRLSRQNLWTPCNMEIVETSQPALVRLVLLVHCCTGRIIWGNGRGDQKAVYRKKGREESAVCLGALLLLCWMEEREEIPLVPFSSTNTHTHTHEMSLYREEEKEV